MFTELRSINKNIPLCNHVFDCLIKYKDEIYKYIKSKNVKQINIIINEVVKYSTYKFLEDRQYIAYDKDFIKKVYCIYKSFVIKLMKKLYMGKSISLEWVKKLIFFLQNKLKNLCIEPIYLSEYSPSLQLEILNINLDDIIEPILDIGCGKNAKLVNYLRELGLDAYGIDKNVDESSFTNNLDWFSYKLKPKYWGTILSHLAFSNFFIRYHKQKEFISYKYASKYKEILKALKNGGSFCYTPDLPFIEDILPEDKYLVNKYYVFNNCNDMKIHATHVKKIT